ncbi:MAG: hypothetical protein GY845_09370 [Planctomycetes bacterium]|nr:hypothetical protein [Planctomycetota bacterium]
MSHEEIEVNQKESRLKSSLRFLEENIVLSEDLSVKLRERLGFMMESEQASEAKEGEDREKNIVGLLEEYSSKVQKIIEVLEDIHKRLLI